MKKIAVLFFVLSLVTGFAADVGGNMTPTFMDRLPRANDLVRLLPRRTPTPTQPPAELKGPMEKFFTTLKTGDTNKAYDELLTGSRLGEHKENVKVLIEKTDQAFGIYGKIASFEIYDNYTVGSNIAVCVYFTYLPMQPLRWRFVYYKPEGAWKLIDLRVDDVLDDLIE